MFLAISCVFKKCQAKDSVSYKQEAHKTSTLYIIRKDVLSGHRIQLWIVVIKFQKKTRH